MPSGITPLPWVARTAWHRLVLPDRQNLHLPHSAVYSGITWSPGLTLVTPSPTSTTIPPPSWPSTAGNKPFGIIAAEREGIGVADAGMGDLHQHFAGLRRRDVDLDDLQRLARFEGDGGTGFHDGHSLTFGWRAW